MRSLPVRPSRMLTNPSVKVTNVGEGILESKDSLEDLDQDFDVAAFDARLDKMSREIAAIPLSEYKKWGGHGQFDRARYEKIFRKYTGDANRFRIYLPVLQEDSKPIKKHAIVPENIQKKVDSQGYAVEDYVTGIAVSKKDGKRKIKIGKLLKDDPQLKKLFDADPQRHASKTSKAEFLAVISRHPYDIAGMSTNRGWTSCMNLKDGCNKHYVMRDVKYGTLVAYLVRTEDKNINKPVGRVRIYRFVDKEDPSRFMFVREPEIYPKDAKLPKFVAAVDKWIEDTNAMLGIDTKGGTYCINPTGKHDSELYTDDAPSTIRIVNSMEDLKALGDDLDSSFVDTLRVGKDFDPEEALNSDNISAIRVGLKQTRAVTPKILLKLLDHPVPKKPRAGGHNAQYNYNNMVREIINHRIADDSVFLKVLKFPLKFTDRDRRDASKRISLDDAKFSRLYKSELTKYKRATNSEVRDKHEAVLSGLLNNPYCPKAVWMKEIGTDEIGLSTSILKNREGISESDILKIFDYYVDPENSDIKAEIAYVVVNYWSNLPTRPAAFIKRLIAEGSNRTASKVIEILSNSSMTPEGLLTELIEAMPITLVNLEKLVDAAEPPDTAVVVRIFERMEQYAKEAGDNWLMEMSGKRYLGEFLSFLPREMITPAFMERFINIVVNPDNQTSTALAEETVSYFKKVPAEVFISTLAPYLLKQKEEEMRVLVFNLAQHRPYVLPPELLRVGIIDKEQLVKRSVVLYTAGPVPEDVLLTAVSDTEGDTATRAVKHPNRTPAVMAIAMKSKNVYDRRAVFTRDDANGESLPEVPLDLVMKGLKDKDTTVKVNAIRYCKDHKLLEAMLRSKDWIVREAVAENPDVSNELLLKMLKDKDANVRYTARRALVDRDVKLPEPKKATKKKQPTPVSDEDTF